MSVAPGGWLGCGRQTAPAAQEPAAAASTPVAAPVQSTAEEESLSPTELSLQGRNAYVVKDWARCADLLHRASRASPGGVNSRYSYDAACCHALAGDANGAFAELERAAAGGLRDAEHMRADSDLTSLHSDARWPAVLAKVDAAYQVWRTTLNTELLDIYEADQADRRVVRYEDIDWSQVGARDKQRQARVSEIVTAGGAKAADDFYHAAMVFQHGDEPEHYQKAHEWAMRAVELNPEFTRARWLAAATEDRYLMSMGKPQKYGTQFRKVDGVWQLYDVDPSVTDEERAKWGVPPLEGARQRAAMMNQQAPK
jgi:hypothetical protein